jgi:hypothetical protein
MHVLSLNLAVFIQKSEDWDKIRFVLLLLLLQLEFWLRQSKDLVRKYK